MVIFVDHTLYCYRAALRKKLSPVLLEPLEKRFFQFSLFDSWSLNVIQVFAFLQAAAQQRLQNIGTFFLWLKSNVRRSSRKSNNFFDRFFCSLLPIEDNQALEPACILSFRPKSKVIQSFLKNPDVFLWVIFQQMFGFLDKYSQYRKSLDNCPLFFLADVRIF